MAPGYFIWEINLVVNSQKQKGFVFWVKWEVILNHGFLNLKIFSILIKFTAVFLFGQAWFSNSLIGDKLFIGSTAKDFAGVKKMLRCIVAHLDSQALTNNKKFRLGKNLQRVCRLSDELRERVSKRWLRELHRRGWVVNLKLTSASERKAQKGP